MSTFPPSTLSGFLFIIRMSTWRKWRVGLPGCRFLEVSSFFSLAASAKHFRRMTTLILLCEPVNFQLRHNQDGQRRFFGRFTAHWHSTFVNLWGCVQRDQPVSLRQRESSLTGVISILLVLCSWLPAGRHHQKTRLASSHVSSVSCQHRPF